jgi:hypothetical protein
MAEVKASAACVTLIPARSAPYDLKEPSGYWKQKKFNLFAPVWILKYAYLRLYSLRCLNNINWKKCFLKGESS